MAERAKAAGERAGRGRRRILVVDDAEGIRTYLANCLELRGWEVDSAEDGARALALLEGGADPDVVLLDVMMPGLDGLEVCRRIRARSRVPILMLTARGDEADRVVGLELGADDYLPKPFSPRELLARIRAVLRRASPALEGERLLVDELELDGRNLAVMPIGERCEPEPGDEGPDGVLGFRPSAHAVQNGVGDLLTAPDGAQVGRPFIDDRPAWGGRRFGRGRRAYRLPPSKRELEHELLGKGQPVQRVLAILDPPPHVPRPLPLGQKDARAGVLAVA